MPTSRLLSLAMLLTLIVVPAGSAQLSFKTQELETGLSVGYAVLLEDVNEDGKKDIVVVDTNRVLWYENPTWKKHYIIKGGTQTDNVCIAAHDIDGDGHLDFALGAAWKPFQQTGTLQWLKRGKNLDELWSIHPIDTEPLIHRIRFADIDGDGQPELLSVPLMGRGATAKANFMDGRPVRITAYHIPKNPASDKWKTTILDESLHVCHNFWPIDVAGQKRKDLLVTAYEGVFKLHKTGNEWNNIKIGKGNQSMPKSRIGASEIKQGTLKNGKKVIATIEPWHGYQVVVYTEPTSGTMWDRHVIDDELTWGHAVWFADLDGDGGDELVIGVRDNPGKGDKHTLKRGIRVYQATDNLGAKWSRQIVDNGGMSCEDAAVADLNGDGRIDIVAVGRFTHNVRIYWNQKK